MTIEEMRKKKTEHGYTHEQIAAISGVPLGTVQKILGGMTKAPRYDTIKALESFFLLSDSEIESRSRRMADSRAKGHGEYTAEDYYAVSGENRTELIDGGLYDSGSATFVRQRIIAELFLQIKNAVDAQEIADAVPLMSPVDVRPDGDDRTVLHPDVLILRDPDKIKRWGIQGVPDFVAEVYAPPASRKASLKRLAKYAEAGVREYWQIDTEARKLIVYPLEQDKCLKVYKLEGRVPIGILGELSVDLKRIGGLIRDYPVE